MSKELAFAEFFATRSPLLAFDELLRWTGADWQIGADDPRFEGAFRDSRAALRQRLRAAVSRPEVREALFLASGHLLEGLDSSFGEEDASQLELDLAEQLVRLATAVQCGGLLLAPAVGEIAGRTSLRFGADFRRRTQIDIAHLTAAVEASTHLPSLRCHVRFVNNSSLYRTHGKVRCLTSHSIASRQQYRVMTTELNSYLDAVLQGAEGGASLDDLVSRLVAIDSEISRDEASSYVGELIDEQVLVPELGTSLTGEDVLGDLSHRFKRFPEADGLGQSLGHLREAMARLDSEPLGSLPRRYQEISNLVSGSKASLSPFRVEVFRTSANPSLSEAIVEEILDGAELLARLERPNDRVRRFTESFFARYGDDVVPLVEALDEQYGIGFEGSSIAAEPLLQGLAFPFSADSSASWGPRERLLLRKLEDAWRSGSETISLSSEEIASMSLSDALPLPDAFAVRGALSATSEVALEAGEYSFRIDSVSGPPGVDALGQFCAGDPQLRERVGRHLRAEEALQPRAIFAEIVHLPHLGDPNLAVRPRFREREISYLGRSGVDPEHRIPLTDLRLSIVAERLRLTSERLDCELIPRLTAPDDFLDPRNPPIYRFLGALQNQGTAGRLQWNWGVLEGAAFLPRVVVGRMVLCRARWTLDGEKLQELAKSSAADRFRAVRRLRERLRLPRFVEMGDGSGRSAFDLDNALSAESLLRRIRTEQRAGLVEMFPMPDALCAFGPDGRYVHELTVPFIRQRSAAPPSPRAPRLGIGRSFPPGTEWLQLNLYTAPAVIDEVLGEVVSPAIEAALASGAVDHWYFMRYADPGFHLRLRLHGAPDRLISEVSAGLRSLTNPLLEDRRLWALKLDTYHRDLGRYGGAEGAIAAEKIFHADSEAVLSIVRQLSPAELGEARWKLALIGIDMLLSDLALTHAQKVAVLKTARDDIAVRLKADASLGAQIARRYQSEWPHLRQLFASEPEQDSALARGLSALHRRSENLKRRCAELIELERSDRLSRPIAAQAYSYIHMFANRLFSSPGLAQELVLYDFLYRLHSESPLER